LRALAAEVTCIMLKVGSQGKLGGQAYVLDVEGVWFELVQNSHAAMYYSLHYSIMSSCKPAATKPKNSAVHAQVTRHQTPVSVEKENKYKAAGITQDPDNSDLEERPDTLAWQRANEDSGLEPPIDPTPDIGKIIKQHGSQTRGEAKSKTASLVKTMYGFNSGQG
ncbi:hypothetical protein DXG01_015948, partial [Tephrocybe rancida]